LKDAGAYMPSRVMLPTLFVTRLYVFSLSIFVQVSDVVDEIFDMVKPAQPKFGISLSDLENCGVGHTVVTILSDAQVKRSRQLQTTHFIWCQQ